MKLTIGAYKSIKYKSRSGIVAHFKLTPKPKPIKEKGTIYQTVHMQYKLDAKLHRYKFTEAWSIDPRTRPQIELKGADSFLIDMNDVHAHDSGSLILTTVAWYESGPVDKSYVRGTGDELWGILHGSGKIRKVPSGVSVIKRRVRASWKMGDSKPTWKL
jgi:hypothetical protein